MVVLNFVLHPESYALVTLEPGTTDLTWAQGAFMAIIRSPREITVACTEKCIPPELKKLGGLQCLEILDTSDLDSVGIVAAATRPIAEAGVSLFAYSTWSSDILFIRSEDSRKVTDALRAAGHKVH